MRIVGTGEDRISAKGSRHDHISHTSVHARVRCDSGEEQTENASAESESGGETRSPFDVEPRGAISEDGAARGTPTIDEGDSASAPTPSGGTFVAGGITFDVPEGWESRPPSSSMRSAEFAMPSGEGETGEAILAAFAGIRGTVDQNINRWIGQVSNPTGGPERGTMEVGDLTVHTVRITGTFSTGMMMGGGAPEPGTTLIGAVITGGPAGPVFLKATGPASVVADHLDAWESLLRSAETG